MGQDLYLDLSATGRIRLDLKNPDPSRGPEDRVLRLNRAVFVLAESSIVVREMIKRVVA